MKFQIPPLICWLLFAALPWAQAEDRVLFSDNLSPCQAENLLTANTFDVTLTPNNNTLQFQINGVSTISGNVLITLVVYAYGLKAYTTTIDPCEKKLNGFCPMNTGPLDVPPANVDVPGDSLRQVPGIAFTVPDLDAKVQIYINSTQTGKSVACVEAELSNGKTVDQKGVAWVLAVISGLALVSSAIAAGLGHSNTAAHVAANAMALFGYFQAQAFIGMTTVRLPPIVASWTQNFQWSMGIIGVGFIQTIATWYQRATGGTPSTILSKLTTSAVIAQKRSIDLINSPVSRSLLARSNSNPGSDASTAVVVKGIERVGYRASVEPTNVFMTGYIFLLIFVFLVVLGVLVFKGVCDLLVRGGRMKGDQFQDFRNGWTTVLKGILFRIVLIGYPQMVVLCFWELTRNDSGAEMVLAIFTIFTILAILGWAASKVIRLARRSIAMHKNPAYILYSDPVSLNKWGFLYVQYKAAAYFFIVPFLFYILVKGLFIAFGQKSGVAQAVGLVIIEAVWLISVCVLRPYMDKKTNAFNISIAVINFVSSVFLLVFSNVFGQPGIVNGAMGVVFFVYNAIFSTVLLIIVLVASIIALTAKNPDTRYQPMRDDRGSFIKSQTQLTTELDALGATARGESKHDYYSKGGARVDDDEDSWSGSGSRVGQEQNTAYNGGRSPMSAQNYASDNGSGRHMPPVYQSQSHSRTGSMNTMNSSREQQRFRQQTASPWQRGAGYD